ncbi:hypothetical protein HanRHA438_Chr12g0569951 [Helianthus annuus]|nr:hypothetical protein HanRHA438_Chr12g0569951 [Helianthus annuus]
MFKKKNPKYIKFKMPKSYISSSKYPILFVSYPRNMSICLIYGLVLNFILENEWIIVGKKTDLACMYSGIWVLTKTL